MQSKFITLNRVRFHHLEWSGDDPPVVFLPGFIANAHAARAIARAVSPTRRVLAFDLRGRGESDKPEGDYGFEQHLQDTKARLEALNIHRLILTGHSFGAVLTLAFANRYPEMIEKIILFDGGAVPADAAMQLFRWYHENLTYTYPSVEAYLAPYRQMITLQPWTEDAEALTRANVIEQPDGTVLRSVPRHVVAAELQHLRADDWAQLREIYPRIHVPVLLVRAGLGSFAREDQHLPDDVLKTITIPDLQVYDMPEAGHTGILTVPDPERDRILREFVKD